MKYDVKSVVFGRRPRKNPEEFKTAFFMLYDCEKPLGTDDFPLHDLEFPNTEYVELPSLEGVRYYLEGNDIVIEGISSVEITQDGTTIKLVVN
jgi:hypothetical protein